MTKRQNIKDRSVKGDTIAPATLTKEVLAHSIAAMFARQSRRVFKPLDDIEFKAMKVIVRIRATPDSVLEPVVGKLNQLRIRTRPKLGAVMRNLPVTQTEAHELFCACKSDGKPVDGREMAARFRKLAEGTLLPRRLRRMRPAIDEDNKALYAQRG